MMLCLNIVPVVLAIPMSRMLPNHVGWYWVTFLFGSLLVIIPIYGWIFEMFAKKHLESTYKALDDKKANLTGGGVF